MALLRDKLDALVHQPGGERVSRFHRLGARIFNSTAEQIAMARALAMQLTDDDVVYAAGEDVGFPLALSLSRARRRPRLIVDLSHPRSRRSRLVLRIPGLANAVGVFIATVPDKVDFVRQYTGLPRSRFHPMYEVTDPEFFAPGPPSSSKRRPIIGACGLEQRDYVTLAEAAKDLEVDVRICAASPNASTDRADIPPVWPSNVTARHYDWPELVQLYRDSDIVAITVRPNDFQAGQTSLMEAMACERPVIMTEQGGAVRDFARSSLVRTVPMRDPWALRRTIQEMLANPEVAARQGKHARQRIVETFNIDRYVDELASVMLGALPKSQ